VPAVEEPTSRPRRPRKLNPVVVRRELAQGKLASEIAKEQGVARQSVYAVIHEIERNKAQIEKFRENRADILASLQQQNQRIQAKVLDALEEQVSTEGFTSDTTANQKTSILHSLTVAAGIQLDKERLERGESTANVSVISKIATFGDDKLFGGCGPDLGAQPAQLAKSTGCEATEVAAGPAYPDPKDLGPAVMPGGQGTSTAEASADSRGIDK